MVELHVGEEEGKGFPLLPFLSYFSNPGGILKRGIPIADNYGLSTGISSSRTRTCLQNLPIPVLLGAAADGEVAHEQSPLTSMRFLDTAEQVGS